MKSFDPPPIIVTQFLYSPLSSQCGLRGHSSNAKGGEKIGHNEIKHYRNYPLTKQSPPSQIKQLFAATGWSKILPLPTDAPTAPQASKTWNVETSTPATSTSIGSVPQPAQAPPPAFGGPPPPAFGAPPPAFGIPPPNPKPSLSIRMKVQHTAGAELDKDDEDFEFDEGDEEDVEER